MKSDSNDHSHKTTITHSMLAPLLMAVMLGFAPLLKAQNLGVDRGQLAATLHEEAVNKITEALEEKKQALEDAALNAVYQEIRKQIQQEFKEEIQASQAFVNQFLNDHPTINGLVKDYQQGKSQEIISQLQGLLDGAKQDLNQILDLNRQAEAKGEEFTPEYKELLNKYGIKGRWIDKVGQWEESYQKYGADKVALAKMLYNGFEGGAPGGQLTLLFDLMEQYSDKVPILGRFVKLYAQVGKEMLNAAIRAGKLIRQREQGCLGTGTHSGIKNWYSLGDPVNQKFNETHSGRTACPSLIKNIFEDIEDSSLLYFWTGSGFLAGSSGNGGISAILSIQVLLRENGWQEDAGNLKTLQRIYNMNFPALKKQAENTVERIAKELGRLQNLKYDCGQAFYTLLREKTGFSMDLESFNKDRSGIFVDMLSTKIVENDDSIWQTWVTYATQLEKIHYAFLEGRVYREKEGGRQRVEGAQITARVTGCRVYEACSKLITNQNGFFKLLVLLNESVSRGELYVTASKGAETSDTVERLIEPGRPYLNDAILTLSEDETIAIIGLSVTPGEIELAIDETATFKAIAQVTADSTANVTSAAGIEWSGGTGNSFKATETGSFSISATYLGLTGTASITVVDNTCPKNEHWDEEQRACICNEDEGFEWSEELGKCVNLEEALEETTEDEEELCDEDAMLAQWNRVGELVAESSLIHSNFQASYNKFLKEINDQNANPCENNLLALAFAGSKRHSEAYQVIVDDVTAMATELILQAGICPDLSFELNISQLLSEVSKLGGPLGQIERAIADMRAQLVTYGCDEQEVEERGNQIAEQTADPEVVQGGGSGADEICGDGIDNDGDGLLDEGCEDEGNFNVAIVLFDSGNLKDDVFGLSVTGKGNLGTTPEGGSRTYPLSLSPGSYVATVTVISAPDNVGTFTITIFEGSQQIGGTQGQPGQGTTVNVSFTVGGLTTTPVDLSNPLYDMNNAILQQEQSTKQRPRDK